MDRLSSLGTKVFADGASIEEIRALSSHPLVRGFTTNPSLMRKAGVTDYEAFARKVLAIVPDRPISFEVLSDDFAEMEDEALAIGSWGKNVVVKIPVTNTSGDSSAQLIKRLARQRVPLNVTAVMTQSQIREVTDAMGDSGTGRYISVFAGRIADTGVDPVPFMAEALTVIGSGKNIDLIWASSREVLNLFQAASIGCPTITMTGDLVRKLELVGKDLETYSLETVKMFHEDASAAGLKTPRLISSVGRG